MKRLTQMETIFVEELSMLDQHKSIQTEETKEGQKERARKAEDAKGKSSLLRR